VRKAYKAYDAKAGCPKCGAKWVESKYDPAMDEMVTFCNCGYRWRSLPLDRAAADERLVQLSPLPHEVQE
jgi:hypothetical protein